MGINRMAFEKLTFNQLSELEMKQQSTSFYERIIERRTVRHFANKTVPIEIIKRAIQSASSAPSGANKQPWHFVIVRDLVVKKKNKSCGRKRREGLL